MKYQLNIKEGFAEFELGRIPLTEIILHIDNYGSVRADVALTYMLHEARQRDYKKCPVECGICDIS